MKKTFLTAALFTAVLAVGAYADLGNSGTNLRTTRYWDACKPSCGWSGKPSENGVCASCNVSGGNARANNDKNACESGGTSYTCIGQAPWAVSDNLSYGFAASHTDNDCGKCFELTFRSNGNDGVGSKSIVGKKMVVMISNIGGDVGHDQLDIMIPGGGVGQFNGLSQQINQNGGSSSNLGAQYGGFRATCGNNPSCITQMCDAAFGSSALSHLKEGCYWYVDWFGITNNPAVDYQKIPCPSVLVNVYKGTETRPSGGTPPVIPPTTTYTLTMSVSPSNSGTTSPSSSQANIQSGTPVNISATPGSGYSFTNWTVTSGSATFANANSQNTTVSLTSNATIRANFTQSGGGTTYTLTVNVNPSGGGTTNPSSSQANIRSGTPVSISATPSSGYSFTNWTVVSGTATIANANSQNTTVTLSANATIRANFNQQVVGSTYTLTLNHTPSGGGSTTPSASQSNIASGAPVNISATANYGYFFVNWTVVSGSATFADADNPSTTVTLTSNATIRANFQQGSPPGGGDRTDTTKIEAESLTPALSNCVEGNDNQPMCVGTGDGGVKNIGYITNGSTANYTINVQKAGFYTMEFRVALGDGVSSSTFTVSVNGTQVGSITSTGTGGWNTYQTVRLNSDVQLKQGENTIVLNFGNAINVDYILLLGDGGTPVMYSVPRAVKTRATVTLKAAPRGFSAVLPSNHAYTSYKLIDLQGREVRSGRIGDGVTDLRFDNLKRSVLLLKLEGNGGTPLVVRAVTY